MKLSVKPFTRGLHIDQDMLISKNTYQLVIDRMRHFSKPGEGYTAATWSDKFRILPDGGRYTKWQTSRTPYMYSIAQAMADKESKYIAISKGSQMGLTALSMGEILRLIHTEPTSIMYFRETGEKIQEWKKLMLQPSLNLPPFNTRRDIRIVGDNVYFPGGYLIANGTGSSNSVAGTTARVIIGDEVAKFAESLEGEGDFFSLATQRSATFEDSKAILFSTPKEKSENEGSFYQLVQRGDVRRYSCPCRHCGEDWFWEPEHIEKYEVEGEVHFGLKCPHCEGITKDGNERADAMAKGKWIPTKKPRPHFVSFEASGMLSWRTLETIYLAFEDAVAGRASMAAFENSMGRFYDPPEARRATPNEVEQVMTKFPYKRGQVPDGVCFLVMACDIQIDRIEWEVKGFGPKFESWSIDRGCLLNDQGQKIKIDETQDVMIAIRLIMEREWKRLDGRYMKIKMCACDYGGPKGTAQAVKALLAHFPKIDYDRLNLHIPRGTLVAVKGNNSLINEKLIMGTPGGRTAKGQRRRTIPFMLGVDRAKFEVYRALKTPLDSDEVVFGRAHAPMDYESEYFHQIVAEEIVVERNPKDGRVRQFFRPSRGHANEALDLHVYTRACCNIIRADGWTEDQWLQARSIECYDKVEGKVVNETPDSTITEQREELRKKKSALRRKIMQKRRRRR